MPDPSRPDDTKPIADPASLFDTDEVREIRAPAPPPEAHPAASEGYDLVEIPDPGPDEPPRPVVSPVPVDRPKAKAKPKPKAAVSPIGEGDTGEFETEVSVVDPIWTRGAEWGPDLARVGGAALATLALAWLTSGNLLLCLLVLAAGGASTAVLCYPVLITLERPVRITPEQAVTDFFAAASHHVPHYRRMWLLLSSAGRDSGPFPGFQDFRDHWKRRVEGWRGGRGGRFAPLAFAVEDFTADKSTGKSTSRAEYTVHVSLRDGDAAGTPIESFRMAHGLVKGPDRMWYLNRGKLGPR